MKIRQVAGAAVASTGLVLSLAGFAGATANGVIGTTGPRSNNQISSTSTHNAVLTNTNNLGVSNSNHQAGETGDARTSFNTTAGGAATGSVNNSNSNNVSASVSNSSMSAGLGGWAGGGSSSNSASINLTGPRSNNQITSTDTNNLVVTNNNNVSVTNTNSQWGGSGDARVSGNTTAGSATTGNVSNSNSSTTSLNVSN